MNARAAIDALASFWNSLFFAEFFPSSAPGIRIPCIAFIVLIKSLNDLLMCGDALLSLAKSLRSSVIVLTKYLVRARFFRIILARSLRSLTSSNSSSENAIDIMKIQFQGIKIQFILNTCLVIFASFVDMHSFAISIIIKFHFCDAYLGI